MKIKEHIKKQREECLKYEVNSEEYMEHWELLNYLCELVRLRKDVETLIDLAIKKGLFSKV